MAGLLMIRRFEGFLCQAKQLVRREMREIHRTLRQRTVG
nr:MAG TPA: hypothetical protein [Caudoviricetes sp.]